MPIDNKTRVPKGPTSTTSGETTSTGRGPRAQPPGSGAAPTLDDSKAPVAPELPAQPEPPKEPDRYHGRHSSERTVTTGVFVRGETVPLARPVETLVPDTRRFRELPEVASRYAADFAVMAEHIVGTPGLTAQQKAARLFEFFLAYAARFVELVQAQQPSARSGNDTRQGQGEPGATEARELKRFLAALAETGFDQLRDRETGRSGLEVARELLASKSVRELETNALQRVLVPTHAEPAPPPPAEQPRPGTPEQFVHREQARASEQPAVPGRSLERREDALVRDGMRVSSWGPESARIVAQPKPQPDGLQAPGETSPWRRAGGTMKRLGPNLLWNVLHRSRDNPDESAVEQDRWDRMTFAAVLVLVGVGLLVIVLVNL